MNNTLLSCSFDRLGPAEVGQGRRRPPGRAQASSRWRVLALSLVLLLGCSVQLAATEAQGTAETMAATDQARFELTYQSMVTATREYVNDALKTIAFLLIAVGWLVTSKRSREFLRDSARARRMSLVAVLVVAVIHISLTWSAYRLSRSKISLLEDLEYMPTRYFAGDAITLPVASANLVIHLALFATLYTLIWVSRNEPASVEGRS